MLLVLIRTTQPILRNNLLIIKIKKKETQDFFGISRKRFAEKFLFYISLIQSFNFK